MSMQYISMELGPIMTNCYIVYDSDTKEAMVVDPAWAYNTIDMALSRYELDLKFIFLTHGHADTSEPCRNCASARTYRSTSGPATPGSSRIRITTCPCLWDSPLNARLPIT